MNFRVSNSHTEWIRMCSLSDICFVGRDALGMASGCHMLFVNLSTGEEKILRANDDDHGFGFSNMAGHKTLKVFAYSELINKPRIFVKTYPDFGDVSILKCDVEDYLAVSFSETELLMSLSGYPSCTLYVWKWRTGEKLASMATNLLYSNQILRSNYGCPVYMVQCAVGTIQLVLWEVSMCGKKCIISKENLKYRDSQNANVFSTILWTTDGGLFVNDVKGNVYTMAEDKMLDLVIKWEREGDNCRTQICWFQGGIAISGPGGEVKHYKKSGNWECSWTVTHNWNIKVLISSPSKDYLIALSTVDDLLIMNNETHDLGLLRSDDSHIEEICMINPIGECIITLAHRRKLNLRRLADGKTRDRVMFTTKQALRICANPVYPYVSVGFSDGTLEMYACLDDVMTRFWYYQLGRTPINRISYAEKGRMIVAAEMERGLFFVIEGIPGSKFKVIASVLANHQIADFILVGSKTCLRLFTIFVTSDKYIAGNNIHRFCIVKDAEPTLKRYELENPNRYYSKLYITTDEQHRDRRIFAMPLDNKNLHELETKRGDTHARIVGRIKTKHMMKRIRIQWGDEHAVSYGYGGLIMIRTPDFIDIRHTIMPHHRKTAGIKVAFADPQGKRIVSLGRDGIMVCTVLTDVKESAAIRERIERRMQECSRLFEKIVCGSTPYGIYEGKSWLEYKQLMRVETERIRHEKERNSILKHIKEVRSRAVALLTKNLEGPENEWLDIQEFNLDLASSDEKKRASKELCERTKLYQEKLIAEHNRVALLIKANFWDKMSEQMRNMWAIFGSFDVQSYATLPPDGMEEERLRRTEEYRRIEEMLAKDDIFQPWACTTREELEDHLALAPKICAEEVMVDIDAHEEDIDELPEDRKQELLERYRAELENFTAYAGSTAHNFVGANKSHYSQFELQCFYQHSFEYNIDMNDQQKLREFFNKQFEAVLQQKIREMCNIIERNAKLRYILSEINYFSEDKLDIIITDPEWKQDENPEKLTVVQNNEVGISPYISPSEQAILDAKAAEAERIRLLLLADDFKERALMVMMNGVLEIRWEDELRKEVPIPKCMTDKDPAEYNEEDLRNIRDYEQKVAFLKSERERYKGILTSDYAKVANMVREGVRKFNERLQELLVLKFQVEAAITQESLRMNRLRQWDVERKKVDARECAGIEAIEVNMAKTDELQKIASTLHEFIVEVRINLENMQTKEKHIDRSFKKEFQDTSATQLEILIKLYKKRPKTNLRSITSTGVLWELAKCVVLGTKSIILTTDALEYLKLLDQLDKYIGIPVPVDATLYAALCRHRRTKIDSEIKIRALQLELTEAENTNTMFHKALAQSKEETQRLVQKLTGIRRKKQKMLLNMDLQIVLKEGFVEIPRTGTMDDFEDAVMISRKTVEDINEVVLAAGKKKLKAMKNAMAFKREIQLKEWEHRKKQMEIEDLYASMADTKQIKVTKEIQSYLKAKARGENAEQAISFEHEVDILRAKYRAIIDQRKLKIAEIDQRLVLLKSENRKLNMDIKNINVDVSEVRLNLNEKLLAKNDRLVKIKMAAFTKRAKLVSLIQVNHQEILVLQAELELLRLRTVPVLEYRVEI